MISNEDKGKFLDLLYRVVHCEDKATRTSSVKDAEKAAKARLALAKHVLGPSMDADDVQIIIDFR